MKHRSRYRNLAGVLAAVACLLLAADAASAPAARQDHHRHLRPAVARRLPAAADQGAEARRGQQSRRHLRGAPARRLRRPVQLGRVQGRRQRLADDHRAGRRARRQGQLPVQPVRLLGRGRHQQARGQDAQGPGRAPARRRAQHHQLHHVRVAGQEAGRRHQQDRGRQHGDAGPARLRHGRPGRRRADLGAGLHHPDLAQARHPHPRRRHREDLEGLLRRRLAHSLSRRCRAPGLDRAEQGADPAPLQGLCRGGEMADGQPGRGRQADHAEVDAGRPGGAGSSIRANSRLGLSLASADEVRREIQAVYKAGMESGFLPQAPSDASIYGGPVK